MIKYQIPYMVQTMGEKKWGEIIKVSTAVGTHKVTRKPGLLYMTFYF